MTNPKPTKTHYRPLSTNQLSILTAIYSCRFVTRSLLQDYLQLPSSVSLYVSLELLRKQNLIARRYEPIYSIDRREAEYYLTPPGLKALRVAGKLTEVTESLVAAVRKDKSLSPAFVQHLLDLVRCRNKLVSLYDDLEYFAARETQSYDYFPSPRPQGFLSLKIDGEITRHFFEYVPSRTHSKKVRYMIQRYITYYDLDEWSVTDTVYPTVLIVAEDSMLEKGIQRLITTELFKCGFDLKFMTTTKNKLLSQTDATEEVWSNSDTDFELALLP